MRVGAGALEIKGAAPFGKGGAARPRAGHGPPRDGRPARPESEIVAKVKMDAKICVLLLGGRLAQADDRQVTPVIVCTIYIVI